MYINITSCMHVAALSVWMHKMICTGLHIGHVYTGCPKKNATSYISLDFWENRKAVFIIYTLLESYISQLSTMKKSQ